MKKLPILTVVYLALLALAWRGISAYQTAGPKNPPAAGDAAQAPAPPKVVINDPEAAALVKQARDTLYQRKSVQADVTQTIAVGSFQFRGVGRYISAEGLRHRLSYTIDLGDLRGEYLEVCDSQLLHTSRKIAEAHPQPDAKSNDAKPIVENDLRRRDIQRIRLALREQLNKPEDAEAIRNLEIGLGGMPAVLASLERTLIFEGVKREFVEGRDYHLVQGRLNEARAKELIDPLGAAVAGQIVPFMPDLVRIYFAVDSLFPEKILYLKQMDQTGQNFRPMVLVEFTNVKVDEPVAAAVFEYPDPGSVERDETENYLAMRGVAPKPAGGAANPLIPIVPNSPNAGGNLPSPVNPGGGQLSPVGPATTPGGGAF